MSFRTLVGEKKALVFPVMCNGNLKIDYNRETADRNTVSTSDDEPYGIFGHDDSFTIQAIITPYDVNGLGWAVPNSDNPNGNAGITTSKKTIPAQQSKNYTVGSTTMSIANNNLESHNYLSNLYRPDYQMQLFHNTNVQLSLINDTSPISSATGQPITNQPSEYKISFLVKADGINDTVTSDKVIISDSEFMPRGYNVNAGYNRVTEEYEKITIVNSGASSPYTTITTVGNENEQFIPGESLYVMYPSIKKVATVSSTPSDLTSSSLVIVYEPDGSYSDIASRDVYRESNKEALYLIRTHHVTASFDIISGDMSIYYNGVLVANKQHSAIPISSFSFDRSDCYIGTNDTGHDNANMRYQFMGELHEFAIISGRATSFLTLDTLLPNYRNTLLYFRFEEVDL